MEHWHGFMLRIVDVEQAIAARPPATDAPEGAFTVHIADPAAPWNQGVGRIEHSGGRLSAARAEGPRGLSPRASPPPSVQTAMSLGRRGSSYMRRKTVSFHQGSSRSR